MYYRTKTASQTDFNGDSYYYETNQQGDVTGLYKITYNATTKALSATRVASYEYDAWGNVTYSTGTMAKINPLKYRGYYHDAESGFYYLQSRYYDPAIGRFVNADLPEYTALSATDIAESNLFTYCKNDPINRVDFDGNWSLPNWAKIAIGAAAIAIGVIATAATGGAAAPVLVASLKIAATSAAVGAVSGASISAVSHRVSTGSWKGAGEAAVNGAIDGAVDGFMWGGLSAGATFTTVAAKGVKIQEIGRLKPSNKPGNGYHGVKYRNFRNSVRSFELHPPHRSGPHQRWHWQRNTWNPNSNSITGRSRRWTFFGRRL